MKHSPLLPNTRFGKLSIIRKIPSRIYWKDSYIMYECLCDCGKISEVAYKNLRKGNSTSCWCVTRQKTTKHNMTKTTTYRIWQKVKSRCCDKNCKEYKNYWWRGIQMCDEWKNSFESFFADMWARPSLLLSLDRINNEKWYFKENCRWSTRWEQWRNTRRANFITYKWVTKNMQDWAIEIWINSSCIYRRLWRGWSVEKSLETPSLRP